ncbi:hypothetical protein BDR07DRAFT_1433068 [Suillus spraguei]|nr:hypothetical protein BDR07DRAFT_1433068 [Suillus spraguei]
MTLSLRVKPRLRLDPNALPSTSSFAQATGLDSHIQTSHSHVSSFRSLLLHMQLNSPSIKMVKQAGLGGMISCPVYADHDKVEGKIILDPSCSQNGRLNISIEGVFEYVLCQGGYGRRICPGLRTSKHKHIFLSSSAVIPISPIPEPFSIVCDVFGIPQLHSDLSLNSPARPSEEMPPTFCTSIPCDDRRGGLSIVEKAEVSYCITAVWEPSEMSEVSGMLEVPILFHPDTDFQSMDGSIIAPELWLEMPLTPERSVPFHCAVGHSTGPQTFSRRTSIPYFVVFTTKPRCAVLAREIAADATIAVSLVRKVTINDDSDSTSGSFLTPRIKLLKRAAKTAANAVIRVPKTPEEPFSAAVGYQPLPELPQVSFSETHTVKTQLSVGFPKRPRHPNDPGGSDCRAYLPDGLYKGKFRLSKDMIPGVDWPGVSVKYYLDVTVLFRQDALRACVPIRVF